MLRIISPAAPVGDDERETPLDPEPPKTTRAIPPAQFARIRTWMKYGMTTAQVAQVYGVPVGAIERILGKT